MCTHWHARHAGGAGIPARASQPTRCAATAARDGAARRASLPPLDRLHEPGLPTRVIRPRTGRIRNFTATQTRQSCVALARRARLAYL